MAIEDYEYDESETCAESYEDEARLLLNQQFDRMKNLLADLHGEVRKNQAGIGNQLEKVLGEVEEILYPRLDDSIPY